MSMRARCLRMVVGVLFSLVIGVANANASNGSVATLKGDYANIECGTQSPKGFSYPYASIGSATFDGDGSWSGSGTTSFVGRLRAARFGASTK